MTLILTQISKFGIIHASDSNLTSNLGTHAGEAQKTFEIPHLSAGLTVAGSYSVGGISMNAWMNNFIQAQANSRMGSLGDFAKALGGALEQEMFPHEKDSGSMVHIAGYVEEAGKSHPEFWFLRNVHGIDKTTGEYQNIDQHFELSEDFWARDSLNSAIIEAFQQGDYQFYINGFASGRIGFVAVRQVIDQFLDAIWSPPEWKFRPPKSINETKILIRMYMQIINSVFQLSDYSAPFIGGDIQTYLIPQPMNSVTSR